MKVTCLKCLGNKKYRGLGSMTVPCEICDGSGHVELQVKLPEREVKKGKKNNAKGGNDEKKANITLVE